MNHLNMRLRCSIGVLLAAAVLAGCAREASEQVDEKKSTVADLAAIVKEQAAHLQRVSAQLDNSVARVAVTDR